MKSLSNDFIENKGPPGQTGYLTEYIKMKNLIHWIAEIYIHVFDI
jgi:hypothetical protein